MIDDITERKQAEEKLQESERTLRTLIDANPESTVLMDTDGTILLVNATTARRFGTTVDKFVGRKLSDVLPPEVAATRMKHHHQVVRTGKAVRFEDVRLGRCMENAVHPILDEQGKVAAVAVLGIDCTERKQAEEALQKAHEELERRVEERTAELTKANENLDIFRKFAEASGEGFGMTDFDGYISYANPTACRLFGAEKPEDALGKNVSAYYPKEYVQRRKTEMLPALLREGHWHIELTLLPRQGKPIQILQSTFLIRDESGNPFRIAAVISDITKRKQAEEALRREHRTLRHLLQSSDHERQTIAYEIHDGLAQYLAGAIMQFDAFNNLKEAKPKQAADAYHAAMTMLRQGHFEARRLISGVRPPILDEQGVVAAVDHLVNEERRKKGPRIEYLSRVEFERLAPIMENAVYRIAQEALTNACRHSKSKKIKVELVQRGDQLRIEVQDQGVGFKLEDVEEGQFGLAGIRERARLLGGQTTIESEPGKGTRIAVELPIVLRQG
jgi:PAS domain S-box-containing protein